MMHDIMEYMKSENFKYLIIKASHSDCYGFNLRVKMERTYAMMIVSPDEQLAGKLQRNALIGFVMPIVHKLGVCHPFLCPNTIWIIPC
jgi:hypothetical protein